jgi:hypothetical protein
VLSAAAAVVAPEAGSEMADDGMSDFSLSQDALPQRKKTKVKPPNITFSVSPTSINEGGGATVMVSTNKINPSQPVTVNYSLTGSAILNTHYTVCGTPGAITIPAGASSATIRISALANDLNLGAEMATITLLKSSAYKLPKRATATVNITNVPPPLCP